MSLLTAVHGRGTTAAKPAAAAANEGYIYFDTDLGKLQRSNGATWQDISETTAGSGSITASGYTQSTARLLGRTTASSGAIEEITVGTGLSLSAGSLSATAARAFGLDQASFDATYGDDFTEASLNARWTRVTQTSGEETYQAGGLASALQVDYSTGAASRYIYETCPAGDWTFEASCTAYVPTVTGQMFSLFAVDNTGGGVGVMLYDNNPILLLGTLVAGAYSAAAASAAYPHSAGGGTNPPSLVNAGHRIWIKLRRASTTYYASYSIDGQVYSPEVSAVNATTMTRLGIGRVLGTQSGTRVYWHWVDKTA